MMVRRYMEVQCSNFKSQQTQKCERAIHLKSYTTTNPETGINGTSEEEKKKARSP